MGPIGLLSFIIQKISVLGDAQVYRRERGRALKAVLVLFFCTVFLHFIEMIIFFNLLAVFTGCIFFVYSCNTEATGSS